MTWYYEFLDSWAFGAYLTERSSHTCNMRDGFVTFTEYFSPLSLFHYSYKLPWYSIDMVLRILRFLGIWCISDREIKSHMQYEGWLRNFYWIFLTSHPISLLIQTALVLDWHGTVDDMVPQMTWYHEFLGLWALSENFLLYIIYPYRPKL